MNFRVSIGRTTLSFAFHSIDAGNVPLHTIVAPVAVSAEPLALRGTEEKNFWCKSDGMASIWAPESGRAEMATGSPADEPMATATISPSSRLLTP